MVTLRHPKPKLRDDRDDDQGFSVGDNFNT
jgi:hypothetical protein